MQTPPTPQDEQMARLLDKLRDHTITLDEAYTLRRWIEDVYLRGTLPPSSHRMAIVLVKASLDSLIVQKEADARG